MGSTVDFATSLSLLRRMQETNGKPEDRQAAWNVFVDRYGPIILRWCRRFELKEDDAADVLQETLLKLHEKLKQYQPQKDKTFRGWLKKLVSRTVIDALRRRTGANVPGRGGSNHWDEQISDPVAETELNKAVVEEPGLVGRRKPARGRHSGWHGDGLEG
jgi:DNA-directed RNA polymerase specialized sigma24 family protein